MLQTWYGVIQIVILDMVTFQWYLLMEKKNGLTTDCIWCMQSVVSLENATKDIRPGCHPYLNAF